MKGSQLQRLADTARLPGYQQLLREMDVNHDGVISLEEWLMFWDKADLGLTEQQLSAMEAGA